MLSWLFRDDCDLRLIFYFFYAIPISIFIATFQNEFIPSAEHTMLNNIFDFATISKLFDKKILHNSVPFNRARWNSLLIIERSKSIHDQRRKLQLFRFYGATNFRFYVANLDAN